MSMGWVEFRGKCPVCGHKGWCAYRRNEPDRVLCMRRVDRPNKAGGQVWMVKDGVASTPKPDMRMAEAVKEAEIDTTIEERYQKHMATRPRGLVGDLALRLGVPVESLHAMGCVDVFGEYWFPMFDGDANMIGVRIRRKDGSKVCVTGSRNGLFIPACWPVFGKRVHVVEGPTDAAALWACGMSVVGRPSCTGSVEMLCKLLHGRVSEVVVWSDRDTPKRLSNGKTVFPGQDGSFALCKELRKVCRHVWRVFPGTYKDVREAYRDGWTKWKFEQVVSFTGEFRR